MCTGPPKLSMEPKPASSMRTRSTLGASSGALGPGMNDQSATESLSVRPAVPPKALSGIGSTVRSGTNLPAASASASFSPRRPCLSIGATDLAGEPASARSASSRCSSSMIAMIAAVPGLSFSPRPSSSPLSTLCLANLPTMPPAAAPTAIEASSGGAARPTSTPTPPPQPMPLRPRWSPVCETRTSPLSSCSTRMTTLALDLLVLDELHEPVEVLLGRLDGLIAGHDDRKRVAHWSLLDPLGEARRRCRRSGALCEPAATVPRGGVKPKLPQGNGESRPML